MTVCEPTSQSIHHIFARRLYKVHETAGRLSLLMEPWGQRKSLMGGPTVAIKRIMYGGLRQQCAWVCVCFWKQVWQSNPYRESLCFVKQPMHNSSFKQHINNCRQQNTTEKRWDSKQTENSNKILLSIVFSCKKKNNGSIHLRTLSVKCYSSWSGPKYHIFSFCGATYHSKPLSGQPNLVKITNKWKAVGGTVVSTVTS